LAHPLGSRLLRFEFAHPPLTSTSSVVVGASDVAFADVDGAAEEPGLVDPVAGVGGADGERYGSVGLEDFQDDEGVGDEVSVVEVGGDAEGVEELPDLLVRHGSLLSLRLAPGLLRS
jgi:hypothetical protein